MALDPAALPEDVIQVLHRFPEFQAAEFIDSGANGYVLTGVHEKLRREVAIKVYYHEASDVDQEPALIASISHENVLHVLDARSLSGTCSFFMTPCANCGDLASHLSAYTISTDVAHKLLTQLLSGLSALHEKNLVHRDLKPENLLVHDDLLLIADFGSVRKVSDETGRAPASRGSVLFRPPEAVGDSRYFNFGSDVYQAGVVGFLLFGGRLEGSLESYLGPRDLKTLGRVRVSMGAYDVSKFVDSCIEKRICNGKLLDWSSLPLFVPKPIVRCLRKATVGARYATCSEFLADLQRAGAGLPSWIAGDGCWWLRGWRNRDYVLSELDGDVVVRKRAVGKKKFIKDNDLCGGDLCSAYGRFARRLGLP